MAILVGLLWILNPVSSMAQGSETPYAPCRDQSAALPTICTTNDRTCQYGEQYPCSHGYCFDTPPIPPNAGIPAGGVVDNKNIEINGNYQITQGATFTNCNFKMHPASLITLAPVSSGKVKIIFQDCTFFSCDSLWMGITTDASAAGYFVFEFENCRLEDAYIGLTLDEGAGANVFAPSYKITGNYFFNNYTGIANLRQNNQILNAVITGNQFFTNAALRPVPVVMQGLSLTDYPLGHAGVEYANTTSAVGANTGVSGVRNFFSCLVHGIIADNCGLSAYSNDFFDLYAAGYGIKAVDGALAANNNYFLNNGQYCIYADGVHLDAARNTFSGAVQYGVYSENNLNGEFVQIHDGNLFYLDATNWVNGIYLERSQAAGPAAHTTIIDNDFVASGSTFLGSDDIIRYEDFVSATDECIIRENYFTIQSDVIRTINCIRLYLGNSNNVKVLDNTLDYLRTSSFGGGASGWGIAAERGVDYNSSAVGHLFRHNTVTGVANQSVLCSFHTDRIFNLEFCDNTIDYSAQGFHFLDENDIFFRENKINRHGIGLLIQEQFAPIDLITIGPQFGRGNMWSTDPNACVNEAIYNRNTVDPFLSRFLIRESNALPYLPPAAKIKPDPTVIGSGFEWVKYEPTTGEDYCAEDPGPGELQLAPFEIAIIEGAGPQTGTHLWDIKRGIYAKLLSDPALRPTGSPAETFFDDLSGASIADFAAVGQILSTGLVLTAGQEETVADANTMISQAWSDIDAADALMDFSADPELSDEWYEARAGSLQNIQTALDDIITFEEEREGQISDALQDAIAVNEAVSVSAGYETARRIVNDYRLRRMAGEPLTQANYEQILALALDDPAEKGQAVSEARLFLGPCDQMEPEDGASEERRQSTVETAGTAPVGAIDLSPNPAAGLVQVVLPAGSEGLLLVYDLTGQKRRNVEVAAESSTLVLNLADCRPGLYRVVFLPATDGQRLSTSLTVSR